MYMIFLLSAIGNKYIYTLKLILAYLIRVYLYKYRKSEVFCFENNDKKLTSVFCFFFLFIDIIF